MVIAMEPKLATVPGLLPTLDELLRREPLFHRREVMNDRAAFEAQIADDYWEVGASGRRYSREFVWSVLEQRFEGSAPDDYESQRWSMFDAHLREIAPRNYLLTYTLAQGERITRRLTVWQQQPDSGWKAVFHQGTIVEPESPSIRA